MDQILWIETVVKGAIGVCLVLSPKLLIKLFALPEAGSAFWPRLVGGLLLAIASVLFLTGAKVITDGIGLGGLSILNLAAAGVLTLHYLSPASTQRRFGRVVIGPLIVLLLVLAIAELALR